MLKRILAAAVGILMTGQLVSASVTTNLFRDGPGGEGYPTPSNGSLIADDGPGLGGGYAPVTDGPGSSTPYVADHGLADGPGTNVPYVASFLSILGANGL
jgi:hypothetical protein